MNVRWMVSLAAATAVLCSGALAATAADGGRSGILRDSTLIGTTVLDPQRQVLGQIKDVLLNAQSGQATFVIVHAPALASGHANLVVPYQALRVSFNPADNRPSVALDLRPDQLSAAPQIRDNQWQVLQNPQFREQARNFYHGTTYTVAHPIDYAVARPIDEPIAVCPPPPCVPTPCPADPWAGWSQEMIDFSSE